MPGVMALTLVLTAIQNTSLPLVIEFSFSREIEDRLLAPLPTWALAWQKCMVAALRGIIAAVVILPLAAIILPGGIHVAGANWFGWVLVLIFGSITAARDGARARDRRAAEPDQRRVRDHADAADLHRRGVLPVGEPAATCRGSRSSPCSTR